MAELLAYTAIGAGIAVGLSCLGSAIGQGMTSSAAAGAIAENEEIYAKVLTLAVLTETQAIYGFIVAMILIAIGAGLVTF